MLKKLLRKKRPTIGFRKTNGALRNLTLTTALEAQQAYINAATAAEMMVESGAFDLAASVRKAISDAAKEGAFVQYPSGHRDRLDVAVRRAVVTGVNQTCAQISLSYADDMGVDLVETTAHPGARPEHAAWQGKVFSRSGRSKRYPDFVTATGYGTGAGLCGWNCRHSFFPFFEGLSESAYPKPYNDARRYEDTQKQRAMERAIRSTKRELIGYDEAVKSGLQGAQDDFNRASVLLKKQETRLRDFIEEKGLQKDTSRVGVLGFGHSQASKAVWSVRKNTLTNASGQTIIKTSKNNINGPPNGITQKENAKGGIDRNYYGADGKQTKQISDNGHGHKSAEAMGQHGEHAHDYVWKDDKLVDRPMREISQTEREENSDIL